MLFTAYLYTSGFKKASAGLKKDQDNIDLSREVNLKRIISSLKAALIDLFLSPVFSKCAGGF